MNAKHHVQILFRFFSIGVIATVIHSAIFSVCIATHIASPQLSNLLACLIALTFSYAGQRYWTFSDIQSGEHASTIFRFISISLLGYGLNAFWVYIATVKLSLSAYYGLLGIGFLTPLMTFMLLKFWVFTQR